MEEIVIGKPRRFEVRFFNDSTGQEEKIAGEFREDEHEVLVDFMTFVDELHSAPLFRNGSTGSAKMGQKAGEPLKFEVVLPHWPDVIVFIHLLRPLILEMERTSFYKVRSLIGKHTRHSTLQGLLNNQKELFSGKNHQRTIQFRSNDILINSEKVLQSYLNGFEYHRDKDEMKFIESLHQMLPLDFSKVIFVGLLIDKAKAIFSLAELVAVITGKTKEIAFQFHVPEKTKGLSN